METHIHKLHTTKLGSAVLSVLSGALLYASIFLPDKLRLVMVCVAIVPLFFALHKKSLMFSFFLGALFGFANGLLMALPVVGMASAYFGSNMLVGYLMYFSLALVFAVWPAIFSITYSYLKISEKRVSVFYFLLIGAIWASVDFLNYLLLPSFPWTNNFLGYYIATVPQSIQLAKVQVCLVLLSFSSR